MSKEDVEVFGYFFRVEFGGDAVDVGTEGE